MADQNVKTSIQKLPSGQESIALIDPTVLKLYANGFSLGFTNADTQIVLLLFGRPIAVVNFSYTLAKTLEQKLHTLVQRWEDRTGQTLQTTDSIDKAFREDREQSK